MKRTIKIIFAVVLMVVLLAAATVGILKYCFDIDIFDRSGWLTEEDGSRYYVRALAPAVRGDRTGKGSL